MWIEWLHLSISGTGTKTTIITGVEFQSPSFLSRGYFSLWAELGLLGYFHPWGLPGVPLNWGYQRGLRRVPDKGTRSRVFTGGLEPGPFRGCPPGVSQEGVPMVPGGNGRGTGVSASKGCLSDLGGGVCCYSPRTHAGVCSPPDIFFRV